MTIRIVHPIFLTKKNQEKFLPRPKIHGQKFGLKISTVKKSPKNFRNFFQPEKKNHQKEFLKKIIAQKIWTKIFQAKKMTAPKIFPKNPEPNFP